MRAARARQGERGFSLIELTLAISLLAVAAMGAASYFSTAWTYNHQIRDKVFAYQKATSILSELHAYVETGQAESASELDAFDDGTETNASLTITKDGGTGRFVAPETPVSGNTFTHGRWKYSRQITVRRFSGVPARDIRLVNVKIYQMQPNDTGHGPVVADVSSVVRTVADSYPSSQVYDVYLVAIENIPGWWVHMGSIKPFVDLTLTDLQSRNPGLKFRTHWITKLAYGRNPRYAPYINEALPSTDTIDQVYFYPGTMPAGQATPNYYIPSLMKGLVDIDGTLRNQDLVDMNEDGVDEDLHYTLADQYNHAMRYPDEVALFEKRVEAGLENPSEPTWRMLLEDLNQNPDRYHNAIIVNLHGELLPMPPLRNYSDAARDPGRYDTTGTYITWHPYWRTVTHPEKLWFRRTSDVTSADTEDLRLRVYSYLTDTTYWENTFHHPIRVEIKGLASDPTDNVNGTGFGPVTLRVKRLVGGLDPVGLPIPYAPFADSPDVSARPDDKVMCHAVRGVKEADDTWTAIVYLYNSPAKTTPDLLDRGLRDTRRLYGYDYVPCSVDLPYDVANRLVPTDFATDLSSAGDKPKNTARWTITVPKRMLLTPTGDNVDKMVRVETSIDQDRYVGDVLPAKGDFDWEDFVQRKPIDPNIPYDIENFTSTYAWWTASPESVPYTERYQFQGDPRHSPYADEKALHTEAVANYPTWYKGDAAAGLPPWTSFTNGYNWYFDDFQSTVANDFALWRGFDGGRIQNDATTNNEGWRTVLEVDVPRFMQLARGAITRSESVYTTLTGFSYYYLGLGGEIGYDTSNGYPNSIPVSSTPFGGVGWGYEQSITSDASSFGSGVKYVKENNGLTPYWWGRNWIGELYPDTAFDQWIDRSRPGNLRAGVGAGRFRRITRNNIASGATAYNWSMPKGTTFKASYRRTSSEGCTSFFNIGAPGATFHHQSADNTFGTLQTAGLEIASSYNFPLPTQTKISRPFRLSTNLTGTNPTEFNYTADYPRHAAQIVRSFYGHSTGAEGSSLVALTTPDGSHTGYIVVNGIDRTIESGSGHIAKYAMLSLLHSFFSAGDPTLPHRIVQLPRVTISDPTAITELSDPSTIPVRWNTNWRRWDGRKYVPGFADTFAEDEADLRYVLMYSPDSGQDWFHMVDGSEAVPGRRSLDPAVSLTDSNPGGDETFDWNVPANSFPKGSYLIRIEVYRGTQELHYGYHTEKIYIER